MKPFRQAFLVLTCAVAFAASPAKGAAGDHVVRPLTESAFGPVACHNRSLTLCQGEFCSVLFDQRSDETMVFDFAKETYVNPMIGLTPKTMKGLDRKAAEDSYSAKFSIDLVGGPANVKFVANKHKDEALNMSAAIRFAYPKSRDRPPVVGITAMQCEKAAPR